MDALSLLHKRILISQKNEMTYSSKTVLEEIKILEISPSGNWIKIQDTNGRKFWKHIADIKPIEVLASLEKSPGKE